jgi:hypothetical protein
MLGAALGMSDNHTGSACVGEHLGGDIASMGTGRCDVTVLGPESDTAIAQKLAGEEKQGYGRAHQHVSAFYRACLQPIDERSELVQRGPGAVHFPVSGH